MVLRPIYLIGLLYLGVTGLLLIGEALKPVALSDGARAALAFTGEAGAWFKAIKPYCNSVEVETRHQRMPPPRTWEGTAFSAACFALAGKIDRAREAILSLPADERAKAAGVVFNVAHPVADAGDDRSAGPIMELVIEFWPNHYMALYHAGMSRYALGDHQRAVTHLRKFLELYAVDDGWRRNALAVLAELESR